jgi:fibronectin-binding autotransporter adhesin
MKSKSRNVLFSLGTVLMATSSADAATYYWDNNGNTAGYGDPASGTWAAPTVSLWSTSNNGTAVPGASITTTTGDSVNFGNGGTGLGAGTITVSGTVNSGNMTFASGSGSILLSGGTINFGNSTITVNNASNTIGSNITGAASSLSKAGTGALILTGASSYAGQTIVNAGDLTIGGSHSGNGNLTVNAAGTMTISGNYSGSGTVTLNGGSLTLTGTHSGGGALNLNAGTFDLGGGTAGGTLASTVLNLNGGSFNFTRNDSATHSFTTTNVNSAASLISADSGNILNLGTVARATGVTFDFSSTGAGTVAADTASNDASGIMSGFTFGDTWAVANGAGVAISGFSSYTLSSVAGTTGTSYDGFNMDVDNSPGTLDAGITANSLRFSAAGANTLDLTGTNILSSGGILVGSGVGANLSTISGGTLAGAASKDLGVIQNNTSGGLTISSDIVNNGGATALTKSGAGLLTLSGTNTFTGGLFINSGTVALGSTGALNGTVNSENAVTFGGGSTGTLALNGNSVVIRSLATNTTTPGSAIVENGNASAASLTVGNSGNQSSTFAGVIQDGAGGGALSLIKAGTGTLDLRNTTNTYSGNTTLNAGQLTINSDANLGATTGDIIFSGNSTLRIENATTLDAGRTITINDGVTATFTSTNNAKTFQGSLEGSGTLFVNHSTAFIFENASNFTGSIRAATANNPAYGLDMYSLRDEAGDGTISLENGSFRWFGSGGTKTFDDRQFVLGSSSGGSIYNRSTDNSDLVITKNLGQTGTGTRTLTLGGNNSASGTFAGDIGDNGASAVTLTKTEGNVWAIGGSNTYSGNTNLVASGTTGRLIFQGAQALSPNTKLLFAQNSSSVQSISFLDDGVGTINFARPIEFGGNNTSQNLNIFVGNNNTANGGSSAGTTTGSTIQSGDITFTSVAGDTNTTRINVTGANDYRLQTGTITLNNLVNRSAGATTVTELNPTGANMTVAAITMAAGNAGPGLDGVPVLRLDGTTSDNHVTGAISESSVPLSLQKQDTSTWTLSGTNTYTGTTTVSSGSLIINGSTSTTSIVSVAAAGTLGGIGVVGGDATISGTLSPGQSPGTLTFSNALTLNNGATYIFEGGDLAAVGGTLTLTNNWTLALGTGLQEGGTVTLFTYGTAGGFDLDPTFDITNLGFTLTGGTGSLSLTDDGSSIVLNGLSVVPEPNVAALLGGLGAMLLLRRRR